MQNTKVLHKKEKILRRRISKRSNVTCTKRIKKAGVASGFSIFAYTVGFVTVPMNSTVPSYDSIA